MPAQSRLSPSRLVAHFALFAMAASATQVGAQAAERRTLAGDRVAIFNIAGTMTVEGGTGSEVTVDITRRGADAAKLTIASSRIDGRESLRVIYPGRRIVYNGLRSGWNSRTTFSVNEDGTFGHGDGDGWRSGDRVEIVSRGGGLEAHADVKVIVPRGKSVSIFLGAGDATVSNVEGDLLIDVQAASLTTKGTKGRLTLDTGSGEVRVTDAQGDVSLDTGSGDVVVSKVKGTELQLDTGSGSVTVDDVEVKNLNVDSGSGDVELRGVRAQDVELDTGSGSVELQLLSDVEQLRVDTGSGGITVSIPESLGAEFSFETGSGGIDVDFPVTVTRRGRREMSGTIGDGKGRMVIESGSGGIRLRRS